MSKEFDAYYKWLGIPPKDQPPNHYRLLGIELFEENPEVIEASAERQASYLHEVSAGPNVKESQKLLNEIAAARLCLLDSERKVAYDARLESKLTANVTVPDLPDGSQLDDLPWDNLENLMTGDPASATTTKGQGSSDTLPLPAPSTSGVFAAPKALAPSTQVEEKPQPQPRIPVRWWIIGGGAALIALVAVIVTAVLSPDDVEGPDYSGDSDASSTLGTTNTNNGRSSANPADNSNKARGHGTEKPQQGHKPDKADPKIKKNPNGDGSKPKGTDVKPGSQPDVVKSDTMPPGQDQKTPDKPNVEPADKKDGSGGKPVVAKGPIRTNGFEPIRPNDLASIAGTLFEVSDDCCVLTDGTSRMDAYTFLATTPIPNITAIRLEALPHKNIPNHGPGRGKNGRFEITELSVQAGSLDGKTAETRSTLSGVASEDAPNALDKLLDGNPNSFWPVQRPGQATTLTMYMTRPLGNDSGTSLKLELQQRHTLAHFRVSVSNDPSLLGKHMNLNATLPLFVNVGGEPEERDGVRWLASTPFENASYGHVGGKPMASNTGVAPLSSCVSGLEAFRVRVPDGKYNVALLFCGRWPENVRSRKFMVSVEGNKAQAISNIPSVAKGPHSAASLGVQVEVKDGILDIDFKKAKGETVLNGVVIQKAS